MNTIALNTINLDAPTQLRALGESMTHVEDLAHSYADTGSFHELPWVALVKETNEIVPIDGFHRLNAIKWLAEQDEVTTDHDLENVDVRMTEFETMAEAIIAAAGVNANHGLKRKRGDIQNAIRAILKADVHRFMESKFKLNKKAIMEAVGCSDRTFRMETVEVRKELDISRDLAIEDLDSQGLSQREIAERTDTSLPTVNRILAGVPKRQDAKMEHSKNEQQESPNETQSADNSDQDASEDKDDSVFTHITTVKPVECPWDQPEEDETRTVGIQWEEDTESPQESSSATDPSFSDEGHKPKSQLTIAGMTDEELIEHILSLPEDRQELIRKKLAML